MSALRLPDPYEYPYNSYTVSKAENIKAPFFDEVNYLVPEELKLRYNVYIKEDNGFGPYWVLKEDYIK